MLAVQVRFLSGRYVATQFNDRDRAEWPPHPMRLYAAAVAAWADSATPDPAERRALEWWESLGPPELVCSEEHEVAVRSVVTHYVPVNAVTVLARSGSTPYANLTDALAELEAAAGEPGPKAARRIAKAEQRISREKATAVKSASEGRAPDDAVQVLPEHRVRQPRVYPSVTPPDEAVLYRWPGVDAEDLHVVDLDRVLARVARLGHSSSPVDVCVVADPDAVSTYVPTSDPAGHRLRVASPGQLRSLEEAYAMHRGTAPRVLGAVEQTYRPVTVREAAEEVPGTEFEPDQWLVFSSPTGLPLTATLGLARTLRAALMAHAVQPPPPILTGHQPGPPGVSTPVSDLSHLACVALPFVGGAHGNGSIQAVALVRPRSASAADRAAVARAVGGWQGAGGRLTLGRHGVAYFAPVDEDDQTVSARPLTWTGPSTGWSSVTPLALDRHPGRIDDRDVGRRARAEHEAEASVRAACRHVGLPEPVTVNLRLDAPLRGTRPARAFPDFTTGRHGARRYLLHVDLHFDQRVRGPLLLGAGRFFGYGLCRPTDAGQR